MLLQPHQDQRQSRAPLPRPASHANVRALGSLKSNVLSLWPPGSSAHQSHKRREHHKRRKHRATVAVTTCTSIYPPTHLPTLPDVAARQVRWRSGCNPTPRLTRPPTRPPPHPESLAVPTVSYRELQGATERSGKETKGGRDRLKQAQHEPTAVYDSSYTKPSWAEQRHGRTAL